MDKSSITDILIVGAGMFGASVAYYLSKTQDARITVIDRNTIGSGATSYAASLINRIRTKTEQIPLVMETYSAIHDLEQELDISLGNKKVGCLHLASSDEVKSALEAIDRLAKNHNIEGSFITAEDVAEMLPWINKDRVRFSYYMPDDVYADSFVLASSYANMAKKNGVIFQQHQEVSGLLVEKDHVSGIELKDGSRIHAPVVVLAGGSWSNLLSYPIGVSLPMAPVRSIYWITNQNPAKFPLNMPMTFISEANVYTRPEAGGMLFGIRDRESKSFNPQSLPTKYDGISFISDEEQWDILLEEGDAFKLFFPDLHETPIAHCITGLSTYSVDGKFIIGPADSVKGVYIASGCVGAGVAVSGGVGRLIKELIYGEPTFMDYSLFKPERLGYFDPFAEDFGKKCSATRSNKNYGG
jgi:4-methylaminobutanoate oxidase (formaldehyde-forming)